MNCRRARNAISLYIDERLDIRQQTRLNRHLEHCADCSAHLEDLRHGLQQLRDLPLVEPSPNFDWNLRRKLAEGVAEQKLLRKHAARSAFWPGFAASAAATLLLCLGAASFWLGDFSANSSAPRSVAPLSAADGLRAEAGDVAAAPRHGTPFGAVDRGFQPVSAAEGAVGAPRHARTITSAPPDLKFPLEHNARQDRADSLSEDASARR